MLRNTIFFTKVFLVLLYGVEKETCLYQYKNCLNGNSICYEQVNNVQKYCGNYKDISSFQGCYRDRIEQCKTSLDDLLRNLTTIKGCTCSSPELSMDEIGECNQIFQYIYSHPCRRNPPIFHVETTPTPQASPEFLPIQISRKKETFKGIKEPQRNPNQMRIVKQDSSNSNTNLNPMSQEMSLRAMLKAFQIPNRVISPTGCKDIMSYCLNDGKCRDLYHNYKMSCSSENIKTFLIKCRSLWKELQPFGLTQSCTCDDKDDPSIYSDCLAHQNYFLDNQALAELENQDQYSSIGGSLKMDKLKEITDQDCLMSSQQCTTSERCLAYVLSEDKCSGKKKEYLSWPDIDSFIPICGCNKFSGTLKHDCIVMRNLLRPDCTPIMSRKSHCVASIRDCINNPECRNAFMEYSEYCLKDTQDDCKDENFNKCLDAKRILLASNTLPSECSCTIFYSLELPGKNSLETLQLDRQQEAICHRFNEALQRSECHETELEPMSSRLPRKNPLSLYDFQADQSHLTDESLACKLTKDYGFKKHSIMRLYNATDYQGNPGQNYCSKICKCNVGCQGIPCLERLFYQPMIHLCDSYQIFLINSNQYICDQDQLWSNRPDLQNKELDLLVSFNLYEMETVMNSSLNLLPNSRFSRGTLTEAGVENLENEINSVMLLHQKDRIKCQFSLKSIQPKFNAKNTFVAEFEMIVTSNNHYNYCHNLGEFIKKTLKDDSSYEKRYMPFISLVKYVTPSDFTESNHQNQARASSLHMMSSSSLAHNTHYQSSSVFVIIFYLIFVIISIL